jgi:hypothetical protein
VSKPFDVDALLDAIREAIEEPSPLGTPPRQVLAPVGYTG